MEELSKFASSSEQWQIPLFNIINFFHVCKYFTCFFILNIFSSFLKGLPPKLFGGGEIKLAF